MWLGGQVFGNFALNPAAATISDPAERGKVVNAGWARYSGFGYGALGAAAVTHAFARLTELRPGRQSRWERILTTLEDLLHVSAVGLTAATGSQGARLGAKGSDGAVPIASGDEPAPQTPPTPATRRSRSTGWAPSRPSWARRSSPCTPSSHA